MEDKKAERSVVSVASYEEQTRTFTEKLRIRDEFTVSKVKDAADKAGFIGALLALIFGFSIWSRTSDALGFLLGLLIAGTGIFAAHIVVTILYGYADMMTLSLEQTRMLQRLAAQKTVETYHTGGTEPQQQEETENTAGLPESIPEAMTADVVIADAAAPVLELRRADQQPGIAEGAAETVDRANRIAHFKSRPEHHIICPICSRKQSSEYDGCFYCGCKFIFGDEQEKQVYKPA